MSTRTSHRRRARRQRRAEEVQSVPCSKCGRPCLSYECFVTCTLKRVSK